MTPREDASADHASPERDTAAVSDASPDVGSDLDVDEPAEDVEAPDAESPDVGLEASAGEDAGSRDSGVRDAGFVDTGVRDTGVVDSGVRDTGVVDTGVRDAGTVDTGIVDSGARDTGVIDVGVRDTGVVDSGVRDTGVRDTGVVDVGVRDAGGWTPPGPDAVAYAGSFTGASGRYMTRLTVAGMVRDVWVYAPSSRGANPPLLLAFHGTNGDGNVMITDSGAQAVADRFGVVVVAPSSRWFGGEGADYDHPGGNGTYWETRTANPSTNNDLLLVRAIMVEARRRYGTDPDRTYAIGHSNGGFMSLLVSVALSDRVAAFAENSAGLVRCASRPACAFRGAGLSCASLALESEQCACAGPSLPIDPSAATRRVPGYLSHGNDDPQVSVAYTCALSARLQALGVDQQTYVWSGGHYLASSFAPLAWTFLSRYTLR